MMEDPVVTTAKSFVGASNRLYKQKWREHFDVLVENGSLSFADKVLEKIVSSTQADLRYDLDSIVCVPHVLIVRFS